MCFNISFKQQLKAFKKDGTILAPDGNINEEGFWNFRDWQCNPTILSSRARELMKLAGSFAEKHPEMNADKYYVTFKNTVKDNSRFEINIADTEGKVYSIETTLSTNELQPMN